MAAIDSHPQRRGSLVAGALGALAGAILIATVASASAAPAPRGVVEAAAPVSAGGIQVFFDLEHVGVASNYKGCTLVGLVGATDNGIYQAKELAGTQLEPCEVTFTLAMTSPLKQWLRTEVRGKNSTKNISLVRLSSTGKPVAALTLTNARLIGLTMPSLNADSSTDAVSITVQLAASESTRSAPSQFAQLVNIPSLGKNRGPYQVTLGDTVQLVSSVTQLRMTRAFADDAYGPWVVKDMTFETSRTSATVWDDWYRGFVVGGRADERSLKVDVFRSGPSPTILTTVTLGGVGLVAADGNLDNPGDSSVRRSFRAYVETVDLLIP